MLGHFGFSYIGFIYLLMLFVPNTIWSKHKPTDYNPANENKVLLLLERTGQVCTTCAVLIFNDFNLVPFSLWSVWLIASLILMLLYEICWIRYFTHEHTERNFYRSFFVVPVPLASLPIMAFLLLGIYGKVIWLIISTFILGIGHIGIHIQHVRDFNRKVKSGV